jgi:hypothetical protein
MREMICAGRSSADNPANWTGAGATLLGTAGADIPAHPAAARAASPAACPAPVTFGSLPRFAHVNGADDITVRQDGNVWITNVTGNQITELNSCEPD